MENNLYFFSSSNFVKPKHSCRFFVPSSTDDELGGPNRQVSKKRKHNSMPWANMFMNSRKKGDDKVIGESIILSTPK